MREGPWEVEGELDLDDEVIKAFLSDLQSHRVTLSFFSGAWSEEFVQLVEKGMGPPTAKLTIIGAETIYSPAALRSFGETVTSLLGAMPDSERTSLVAAKKIYFGVGGSMQDFCDMVQSAGLAVEQLREESDGVRRAVVEVVVPA